MIPLLVDLETEWRGGQNQFLLLLKGLYERGHPAELLAARGSALGSRAAKAGICVHRVSREMFRLPAAIKVHKLLRDGRFDLIHVNESHALTAAWLARAPHRLPMIFSRRVGYPLGQSAFAGARFRSAKRIIANSNWVAEQAVASGAAREKISVVYEGVAIPPLPVSDVRQSARSRWGVLPDQTLLGCVGVLLPDKGQEWVIRALAQLRSEFPNCRLLLAGEGPHRSYLEDLARRLGVFDLVIFAGFVKEIESVYQALDIFLFPVLFEGLGTSLLAAMSYAVPCITFHGCALGEIVENGRSGIQVDPQNSEQIAQAVGRILRDPRFAADLARAGRLRIEQHFSAETMVEATARIYMQVLSGVR